MNKGTYTVVSNERIAAAGIWKMILRATSSGPASDFDDFRPGQFVNLALKGHYLRRPISVCDWDCGGRTLTLVYRVVGAGTKDMSCYTVGTEMDVLTGLGNGFTLEGRKPLLVGGGVGLPPMLALAKAFLERGIRPIVAAGFADKDAVILEKEFAGLGLGLHIATMDGSAGAKGTVMNVIDRLDYDYIYACGPKPMLKALSTLEVPAQLSVEERMGCGYGVCMGCTCKTADGFKRVCKDGPVFKKEVLVW